MARNTVATSDLVAALAAESLVGPVILLDAALRVIWSSPAVAALLGEELSPGTLAPRALCGGAVDRPIAEALAAERAVSGTVMRPTRGGGARAVRVRANPLRAAAHGEVLGWVMLVGEESIASAGADEAVHFHGMWTRDHGMKQVFHVLERASRRSVPVLVRGETGSGKELVARAVHALSPRAKGPFRAINCAALPAALLESELFGHVRGSFTGATRDHPGIFRAADRGTLFLDEVAEMPLDLQAKLLRVLETRTVIPVGGSDPVAVDVRIVAATHQSLRRAVELGRFRADLMYRLRVVPIFLPPLRSRRGDIELLVSHLIDALNDAGERQVTRVSPGAMATLRRYPWPGNVRELRNALEYAFVIGEGSVLTETDLPPELLDDRVDDAVPRVNTSPPITDEDPEGARIRRALERAGGNRQRAAKILGMSRVTLWRRLRELGIEARGAG